MAFLQIRSFRSRVAVLSARGAATACRFLLCCQMKMDEIRPRSISCVAVVVIRKSILLYFLLSTSFPLFVIAAQWVQKVGSVEFPKRNDDPFLAHGNIQSFFFLHKTFLPLFPFTLSLSLSAFVCVCVRVRSVFTLTANVASRSRRL